MRFWLGALLGAIVVVGIAIAGLSYAYWNQTVLIGSMAINYVRYWSAPAGTLETEVAQTGAAAQPSASTASASPQATPGGTEGDWPNYNKTLTSNRFSHLSQINRTNADKLKVLCTYDTRQYTGFNSGLLEMNGALGNSLQGVPITGGATWTSYSLDPDTGLLYVPGGNPAPDFATDVREGPNLYSGSVVVLDAMTGAYKNHFKIVPKDWHDWDVSGAPAIIKTAGGKKVLSVAPKDG